ncbi:MAG TPA: DUF4252 domain-containing protein [Saprospiraceae bacterium]|nr:DUF4252 domain-containing protein [Saprospiraceae bacterium]
MKTFLFSFCLIISAFSIHAQDYGLYWKYKDYDGIALTVPSAAIDVGSWFVDEKADRVLLRKINKVRVLVFEDVSPVSDKDLKKFDRKAKRKHLDDLVYVREGKTRVRIMAKEKHNAIRKVVVLVQSPDEFVLVSVKGHLRLDDINRVIEKYGKEKTEKGEPIVPPGVKIPVYKI